MIEKTQTYKASDGSLHEKEEDALNHEAFLNTFEGALDMFLHTYAKDAEQVDVISMLEAIRANPFEFIPVLQHAISEASNGKTILSTSDNASVAIPTSAVPKRAKVDVTDKAYFNKETAPQQEEVTSPEVVKKRRGRPKKVVTDDIRLQEIKLPSDLLSSQYGAQA